MNKSTEVFKKFGKTIPKDCYVVIIKDIEGVLEKKMNMGDDSWGTAIDIAVNLYLDIINLFLDILYIMAESS